MRTTKLAIFALTFLTVICLTACQAEQTTEQTPAPTKQVSLALPDFSQAYSIVIIDNWGGLSPTAPINKYYALEMARDNFEGAALFSVGGYFADTKKDTTFVSIPKDIMQVFLTRLSEADPTLGKYEPFIEHTDDYPEIIIRITYGNAETIEFYTKSQGKDHSPWKVTYAGKSYVVNSGIPVRALEILKPYLAPDILQTLIDQVK